MHGKGRVGVSLLLLIALRLVLRLLVFRITVDSTDSMRSLCCRFRSSEWVLKRLGKLLGP